MNALKLSMFDSVAPFAADYPVAATPRVRTRRNAPAAVPATLWRQSLAAHEHTAPVRWTLRGCFAVLGTLSAVSVAYSAIALFHCVLGHDGLQAAVHHLMGK